MLDLADRRVLVVGGGAVASRKVRSLMEGGATNIVAVAPQFRPELAELAQTGQIELHERRFEVADVPGSWLIIAATNDPKVNSDVASAAARSRIWCINSGDAADGSAASMARFDIDGSATIAVSGHGDPTRAANILEYLRALSRLDAIPTNIDRRSVSRRRGHVALIGAGPGDPSLLTLRAVHALHRADVLVMDRLAPQRLSDVAPPGVEVIDVGKAPGKHAASQAEINEILVSRASEGKYVARVKGGDPFVLGRGGEEALACVANGIPVEVIPGITSAIAVPAAVGIPVTQRGITSSFIIASAHEGPDAVVRTFADAPHESTLILLMGAGSLPKIARALVDTGRDHATPVAVVSSGWTPNQRALVTTLGDVAAESVPAASPAVVVIGDVVRLSAELGFLAEPTRFSGHA